MAGTNLQDAVNAQAGLTSEVGQANIEQAYLQAVQKLYEKLQG